MFRAARGTPLTILMMLEEAINDAVTEQWLDFSKMVAGGWGCGGHHPVSNMNLYVLQQASTAKPQQSDDEGVYFRRRHKG